MSECKCVFLFTAVLFAISPLSLDPAHSKKIEPEFAFETHASYPTVSDLRPAGGAIFRQAQVDTYMLAEFEFETQGKADTQGWYGVDITEQLGTFFHVDTFRVITGSQSLWCGVSPSSSPPFCGYASLPGYGNLWDQRFESKTFHVSGDVTVSFDYVYDSEDWYDYTYAQFSTDGGVTWNDIQSFTGTGSGSISQYVISGANWIKMRFRFVSDSQWSDEDGLYDSQGAIVIDNIEIADSTGTLDFQDFESESVGDMSTLDGDWVAYPAPGYGDFAGLFPGLSVLQDVECEMNPSYLWGFFEGSPYDYGCAGYPEQKVVPYKNDRGQYINNEIWSPWIEWNPGGSVPPTAKETILEFWKYQKGTGLNSLIFPTWHVRSLVNGCPTPWVDNNIIYWGPVVPVVLSRWSVGDLIEPGATQVQIALGVIDMCWAWCGIYGTGECHSHAPLYDHVKLYRLDYGGPVWSVRDIDLFQDNFPSDGTITGTVRCDMSMDTAPSGSPNIYPGDSVVVTVSDPNYGLGLDGTYGKAAVYIHVRSTGGQTGDAVSGDPSRWPVVSVSGGWTKILMDTGYDGAAMPVPDKFCVDLNDNLFTPPDRIDFYFSAANANGNTTYWSREAGLVRTESMVQEYPMEMQCLPTGGSDILYVDDFDGGGAQPYFDTAFEILQITPDRFDTRGHGTSSGSGLGSRASASQIVDVYHVILWNSGIVKIGTIGAGQGYSPDKSPDAQLLFEFLDQSSLWNPGLYISGDNVAEEMFQAGTTPYTQLFTYIGYNLLDYDHVNYGLPISPLVGGLMPGTIFQDGGVADEMVVEGGCPRINDFDVLEPAGTAAMQMHYDSDPTAGAVISQATSNGNGMTARVVLSGFSYHFIRDDRIQFPPDRVDHLRHILQWMEEPTGSPTGVESTPMVNCLEQNYPNPFNPTTTIRFAVAEKGRVTLKVYDISGKLVRTLVDRVLDAGTHAVSWDGQNDRGEKAASGVYFYRLSAGDFVETRKMVLLK